MRQTKAIFKTISTMISSESNINSEFSSLLDTVQDDNKHVIADFVSQFNRQQVELREELLKLAREIS